MYNNNTASPKIPAFSPGTSHNATLTFVIHVLHGGMGDIMCRL